MKVAFRIRFIVIGMMMVMFSTSLGRAAETTIALGGVSQAVVVVSPDASESEKHAAAELASFLEQVTGAKFEVRNQYDGNLHRLLVGPGAAKLADQDFSTEGLGTDGIVLRTVGQDLILAGGRPRGTLYAVYTFLEDALGCRWWSGNQIGGTDKEGKPIIISPAETFIPSTPTLKISSLDLRYVPQMEFREPYWGNNLDDPDWCVRNKAIGQISKTQDPKHGGHFETMGHIQSFWFWIPPDKYFAAHPEWFSEIDGKRVWQDPNPTSGFGQAQLCLTNQEVAQEVAKNMITAIAARPVQVDSMFLAPNDWGGQCECANCRKVYDEEGSPAGTVLAFVNTVAEIVEKEYPDIRFYTGAYCWYQEPPKHVRPRPNVIVWYVTSGVNLCKPLFAQQNALYLKRMTEWAKICGEVNAQMYVWDHGTNFTHFLAPHPDLYTWRSKMKLFHELNVKGIFFLASYSRPNMELATLRNWVMAKLLWNPTLDPEELISRFMKEYYGPAATFIRQYLDTYQDAYQAGNQDFDTWMWSILEDCQFLSAQTLAKCMESVEEAEKSVKGDAVRERRIKLVRMPLLYLYLIRWDELKEKSQEQDLRWPFPKGIKEVCEEFETTCKEVGIAQFAEGSRSWWPTVKERVSLGDTPPPPPPSCENLPPSRWVVLQEKGFNLSGGDFSTLTYIDDPSASDGKAAVMPAKSTTPSLMRQMWNIPLNTLVKSSTNTVHGYISVKCQRKGKEGMAFSCGVEYRGQPLEVKVSEIADDTYHTYDLGSIKTPGDWIHLWIKAADNPDNVESVLLDRAWLVAE